jgi:hypothetical protein
MTAGERVADDRDQSVAEALPMEIRSGNPPQTIIANDAVTCKLDDLLPGDQVTIVETGGSPCYVEAIEKLQGARRILQVTYERKNRRPDDIPQSVYMERIRIWLWSFSRIEVLELVPRPATPAESQASALEEA